VIFADHNLPKMDNGLPSPGDPQRVLGDRIFRALLTALPHLQPEPGITGG
jgi:hypothetical protein